MIVDASAIIAIVVQEPGFEELVRKLQAAEIRAAGAPTLLEVSIVLAAKAGADGYSALERFVQQFGLITIPFGEEHRRAAVDAFFRFGKGRHPARLNFGDCMAYATAKLAGEPLLFTGDDFAKTDIEVA